jgi:hypothetical protein
MVVRVAGLFKHPKSKNWWFRQAVPERYRTYFGKREIKFSLETTDANLARSRHAERLAEYHAQIAQFERQLTADASVKAEALVHEGLNRLAANRRSQKDNSDGPDEQAMDAVIFAMLSFLALRVRQTWGRSHEESAVKTLARSLGESGSEHLWEYDEEDASPSQPLVFHTKSDQADFVTRANLYETNSEYQGLANREIARQLSIKTGSSLLRREGWRRRL